MSDELTRGEFNDRMNDLREWMGQRFDTTDANFVRMNGRVGKAEERIGDIEGDIKVLKDRGDQTHGGGARDGTARNTSLGAILAAAGGILWTWWKG